MHLLIPVKRFALAKTRLVNTLSGPRRGALARAMLCDLLEQIAAVHDIKEVVLLSEEPELHLWARRFRLRLLRETVDGVGLNAVLTAAAAQLQREGVRRVLLLHADLPLACTSDLQKLVDDHGKDQQDDIVLVSDRMRLGTNAMMVSLPLSIDLCYGAASFDLHQKNAARRGVPVTIVHAPSLAYDVDIGKDVDELHAARRWNGMGPARHTAQALKGLLRIGSGIS